MNHVVMRSEAEGTLAVTMEETGTVQVIFIQELRMTVTGVEEAGVVGLLIGIIVDDVARLAGIMEEVGRVVGIVMEETGRVAVVIREKSGRVAVVRDKLSLTVVTSNCSQGKEIVGNDGNANFDIMCDGMIHLCRLGRC